MWAAVTFAVVLLGGLFLFRSSLYSNKPTACLSWQVRGVYHYPTVLSVMVPSQADREVVRSKRLH